jgi:hypothetical protein
MRTGRTLAAAVLVAAMATAPAGAGDQVAANRAPARSRLSATLVPAAGVLWGTTVPPAAGSRARGLRELERRAGRRFDVVHAYHLWDQAFPTATERAWAADGRILLLNWKPRRRTGAVVPWAAIADGVHDARAGLVARRLRALGKPVFLAFHHEPEDEVGTAFGTATDYARAFRHLHRLFAREGAGNVVWVWNVMGFVAGHGHLYRQLYPGDGYVDWIAYDPYNWHGCRSGARWRSFAEATRPFYRWATANHPGRPLMLAEYGTREHGAVGDAKARWFTAELRALQTTRRRIRAAVYFNTDHRGRRGCDWRTSSSTAAQAAFTRIGRHPYLNPIRSSP